MIATVRTLGFYLNFLIVVFHAASSPLWAQLANGTIQGVVRDSSGAVIPGVDITVRNVGTNQARLVLTNEAGVYRVPGLAVGNYNVTAELVGFATQTQSNLVLNVGQEAVVNFVLEVGPSEQEVTVVATAPLVNTTSGSIGDVVDQTEIADLPLNGRNYIDLTLMQPGIAHSTTVQDRSGMSGTWFSSNGAPTRSNNYLLDGAPIQNVFGGTSSSVSGSTLGVEGIQEFRVLTNSFGAEYGNSMGSQTVVASKSGTNEWHGSAFEYLRNSALDARNFFDRPTLAGGFREKPVLQRNNFGGSFGGPIKQDTVFFFGVYEGLRQNFGATPLATVMAAGCHGPAGATLWNGVGSQPAGSSRCDQLGADSTGNIPGTNSNSLAISPLTANLLTVFPVPNLPNNQFTFPLTIPTRDDYGQIRVDVNFSNSDKVFGRYTIQDTSEPQEVDYPNYDATAESRLQYVTLAEDHVFSSGALNSVRVSYSRPKLDFDYDNPFGGPGFSFIPGYPLGGIRIGGVTQWPRSTPNLVKMNTFTLGDDVFIISGRHSFKFGALITRQQQYSLLGAQLWGSTQFPSVSQFMLGNPSVITALTPGSIPDRDFNFKTFGFYFQDDFRVSPNLTLNLGLRYEFATEFQEANGLASALRNLSDSQVTVGVPFKNPTTKNFSPRLGFAWDVRGDGTTSVRGGAAILYDLPTNFGNSLNALAIGTPPFSSFTNVSSFSDEVPFTIPFTLPMRGLSDSGLHLIDYNLKQPYLITENLTVEQQLPFGIAASLTYAGSIGRRLVRQNELNPNVAQILPDGRSFWPADAPKRNPNFGTINILEATGRSSYNSLQFSLRKRLSDGLQFQSSYTWSRTIDLGQAWVAFDSLSSFPTDPERPEADRGVADFDIPHLYRFNIIYNLPGTSATGIGSLLNNWWVGSIVSLNSGTPFSAVLLSNRSRSGNQGGRSGIDRADLAPGRTAHDITHGVSTPNGINPCPTAGQELGTPSLWFDPCAFTIPAAGFLGNQGRNTLRGPGFSTWDLALGKDMALGFREGASLGFRVEFFNLLNHANFALPQNGVYAARNDVESPVGNAGQITSTVGTSRQIQFSLRVDF